MMAESQLKPCPFCGNDTVYLVEEENKMLQVIEHKVFCEWCDISGPAADTEQKAARLWNIREGQRHGG